MRELGTCLPAEGHGDRLQRGNQPVGLTRVGRDELGHPLREDTARAVRIPADEFAHGELDMDRARASGEVHQVALIAALECMDHKPYIIPSDASTPLPLTKSA
jgi:hypothetical protein